ncbi:zinc finger protein 64 [Macrotis lagotis]|uniref:zinc finger protein 64 n=1 Tax=Macrotis lagotis TaxID=92651 RepID=UPI003D68839A
MNASGGGEGFPGSVQFPGGTTVLVELTPDIHICGICKQQFNNLDAFVAHKQSGCQLTSTAPGAPSAVQFVSEETVPATQTQTTTRTITSETQTITVSAPEFVFEHGYQTYLPTDSSDTQTATVISVPPKSRPRKPAASPAQKKLNCCYPGCQFKTAYGMKDMERHLRTHTGDKPHKCEVCSKCFSRKDKLKMHMRSHTGVKPYKCKSCDYAAADSSSLNKHQRIHSNERPFKCQICPYASRNSSQLTVHLRSHTGDAPFQCQMCSAKFKINSDLKRHLRVHSGEKPYKCEFCEVRCAMKGNLKSHVRLKHNADNTFKCGQCDFQCGDKTSLRRHARSHQPEQPVKCPDCSYSCAHRAALKVHERIHGHERPFKCDLCSFDTKQRSNLTTHVKKVHGDRAKGRKPPLEKSGAGAGAGARPRAGGGARQVARLEAKKAFQCEACEASFVREDSLRSHRKQHGEYGGGKQAELALLQLPGAPLAVGPLQPSQLPAFGEGRLKIIVGPQAAPPNALVQAASVSLVPPAPVGQAPEDLPAGGRLQILRQVSLMAPTLPPACPAEAPVGQPVLLSGHDQAQGPALHQPLPPGHEGAAGQPFIAGAGISCSDLEGLHALIQEGAAEVTVVSGQSLAGAATPSIYPGPAQAELPKQAFSILPGGAHAALLCPADAIPD